MTQLPRMNLNHAGIWVADFDPMFDFYTRVLGFAVSDRATRDNGDEIAFLTNDPSNHHTLVLASGRDAKNTTVNQISFRVPALDDVRQAWLALKDEPMISNTATACHGNAWSFYFHDPEGNRLEIYTDTPWHVSQPCRMDIDFSESDDAIMKKTEDFVRDLPGFQPYPEWSAGIAEQLGIKDYRPAE